VEPLPWHVPENRLQRDSASFPRESERLLPCLLGTSHYLLCRLAPALALLKNTHALGSFSFLLKVYGANSRQFCLVCLAQTCSQSLLLYAQVFLLGVAHIH